MPNANAHKIKHITGCRCGCGASFDYSQFKKLSDTQLYLIDGFITPRIFRVLKADPVKQMNAIEISLVDAITSAYGIQSKTAINRAVKVLNREAKTGKWNQSKIDKILQPIADAIGPKFSQKQASRILQASIGIYNIQKKFESDRAGIKPSFTVVDDIAKRGIAQNNMYWIGARYGNDIGPRLRAIVGDILITQGLPLNEAADAMARAMGITLGVARKGAEMPAMSDRVKIPRGFTGSSRDYFRGVASAIRTTGTSFASIQTFREVGFNWYVLSNPMDSQTTRICAFMNGKVFRVSDGSKVMNNYMAATTPTDAKAAMPWMSLNELGRRVGFADAGDFEQKGLTTAALAAQNVALPPFHFRCRTVAEPSGSAGPIGVPRDIKPTRAIPRTRRPPVPSAARPRTESHEIAKRFRNKEDAEAYLRIEDEYRTFFDEIGKQAKVGSKKWERLALQRYKQDCKKFVSALDIWQTNTQLDESMMLRLRAQELEKGTRSVIWGKGWTESERRSLQKKIQNDLSVDQYLRGRSFNQIYLERKGVESVRLYRGTDGRTGSKIREDIRNRIKDGNISKQSTISFDDSTLSGYSKSKSIADGFGSKTEGITITLQISRSDVLVSENLLGEATGFTGFKYKEREWIVFGKQQKLKLKDIDFREGD